MVSLFFFFRRLFLEHCETECVCVGMYSSPQRKVDKVQKRCEQNTYIIVQYEKWCGSCSLRFIVITFWFSEHDFIDSHEIISLSFDRNRFWWKRKRFIERNTIFTIVEVIENAFEAPLIYLCSVSLCVRKRNIIFFSPENEERKKSNFISL